MNIGIDNSIEIYYVVMMFFDSFLELYRDYNINV